jgi:hypothetical protein
LATWRWRLTVRGRLVTATSRIVRDSEVTGIPSRRVMSARARSAVWVTNVRFARRVRREVRWMVSGRERSSPQIHAAERWLATEG